MTFNRVILTTTLEGEVLAWEVMMKYAKLEPGSTQDISFSDQLVNLDEVARNDYLKRLSREYYLENPVRWLRTIPDHLLTFWFGGYRGDINFLYYATTGKHHALSLAALFQKLFHSFIDIRHRDIIQVS